MAVYTDMFLNHSPLAEPDAPITGLSRLIENYLHRQAVFTHPRHHQHHAPQFNVRETSAAYFLEGQFPGIRDVGDIRAEWVGHGTLVIEATVSGVDLEAEWDIKLDDGHEASETGREQSKAPDEQVVRSEKEGSHMRWWLTECPTGKFRRSFTFPTEIDEKAMRARLGQGLLKIMIPKMRKVEGPPRRVRIES